MKTTTEKNEVASKVVDTLTHMSEIGFSSIERLTALNLNMARESLQQGIAASVSIARSQNGKGQDKDKDNSQNPLSGEGAERLAAYVRGVQEVLSEAQSEFAQLLSKHMSSFGMNGLMSFPGMEVFEKVMQQTSDMTKTNIRNATEVTESVAEAASSQRRKSA